MHTTVITSTPSGGKRPHNLEGTAETLINVHDRTSVVELAAVVWSTEQCDKVRDGQRIRSLVLVNTPITIQNKAFATKGRAQISLHNNTGHMIRELRSDKGAADDERLGEKGNSRERLTARHKCPHLQRSCTPAESSPWINR